MSVVSSTMRAAAKRPTAAILQAEHDEGAPGVCEINGKRYAFRTVSRSLVAMTCAHVRLFVGDGFSGDVYDCVLFRDGREDCSCGDFIFRCAEKGQRCKHLQALVNLGLLGDPVQQYDENEAI